MLWLIAVGIVLAIAALFVGIGLVMHRLTDDAFEATIQTLIALFGFVIVVVVVHAFLVHK